MLMQLGDNRRPLLNLIGVLGRLANFIKGKRVLLLFDNVTSREQGRQLIKCCKEVEPDSCIIFTCRNVTYLDGLSVSKKQEVPPLPDIAAFSLICKVAEIDMKEVERNLELKQAVTDAAKACGGLPLALEVLGSSLMNGDVQENWQVWCSCFRIMLLHIVPSLHWCLCFVIKSWHYILNWCLCGDQMAGIWQILPHMWFW